MDEYIRELKKIALSDRPHTRMSHEFYVLQRDISGKAGFTAEEYDICAALKDGPLITSRLAEKLGQDITRYRDGIDRSIVVFDAEV